MVTTKEGLHKLDVLAYLVDVTCTAWVITCGLDTTAEGFVTLKAYHVVGLPAVERDLLFLELVQYCVGVDANGSVALFCYGISLFNQISFHFLVFYLLMIFRYLS